MKKMYSGMTHYGKAGLPSVESYYVGENIAKDPPRSVVSKYKTKVGDTTLLTREIDDSSDRFCEAILKYPRGVNQMVTVSYNKIGTDTNSREAFLPHRVVREGAFRPPIVPQEDRMPLSRLPRKSVSMMSVQKLASRHENVSFLARAKILPKGVSSCFQPSKNVGCTADVRNRHPPRGHVPGFSKYDLRHERRLNRAVKPPTNVARPNKSVQWTGSKPGALLSTGTKLSTAEQAVERKTATFDDMRFTKQQQSRRAMVPGELATSGFLASSHARFFRDMNFNKKAPGEASPGDLRHAMKKRRLGTIAFQQAKRERARKPQFVVENDAEKYIVAAPRKPSSMRFNKDRSHTNNGGQEAVTSIPPTSIRERKTRGSFDPRPTYK